MVVTAKWYMVSCLPQQRHFQLNSYPNLDVLTVSVFCVIYCITSSFSSICDCAAFVSTLSFIVFIRSSSCFMITPTCWRKQREQRGRMKENVRRWGRQRGDNRQGQNNKERKTDCEAKWIIRMEGKKRKGRQARKNEMWVIHKQTTPKDLGPAHLLLFTSEEIDTLWKRGSWPQDKTAAAPN